MVCLGALKHGIKSSTSQPVIKLASAFIKGSVTQVPPPDCLAHPGGHRMTPLDWTTGEKELLEIHPRKL